MPYRPPPSPPSALVRSLAPRHRLDPAAVIAVLLGEGGDRWGAVGDQGSSYGPFQLHRGGALPQGQGPEFANSPQGIEYALSRMAASGAAGLKGSAAINAIIRRFERPADPGSSVARALARLGANTGDTGFGGGIPPGMQIPHNAGARTGDTGFSGQRPDQQPDLRKQLALELIRSRRSGGRNRSGVFELLNQLQQERNRPEPTRPAAHTAAPSLPGMGQAPAGPTGPLTMGAVAGGKIIGGPGQGTHSHSEGPNNWESDNAYDIAVPVGTPVYATEDGVIGPQFGSLGRGGRFAGLRLHLVAPDNEFYYAHLSRAVVKPGERVRRGQLLGYSGEANGVAHLHLGRRN